MRIAAALILGLFCAAESRGQATTGTIAGFVLDPAGRPVAGAAVTVRRIETGRERETETDDRGSFTVPLLAAGTYRVTLARQGFRTAVREGIRLEVAEEAQLEIRLEVGPIEQVVTVSADAPPLQHSGSALGTLIGESYVRDLPLNGREFLQLGLLAPGGAPPAPGSELSTQSASGLHFNGGRESANNFLLDGVDNNDWFINRIVVSPPIETIQEFRVQSASYSAEFGRSAGAQVLVVTRSGASRWHGSVYEFLRNAALDARNLFDPRDQPIPKFQRNQFGLFAAGRLSARTFVSAGYEGTRLRQAVTRTARVPGTAEKNGDFSAFAPPILDPFTGQPFPGNRIPSTRMDRAGAAIARRYPDPNRPDPGANFVSTPVGKSDPDQIFLRIDRQLRGQNTLFVRYNLAREDAFEPFNEGVTNLPGFGSRIPGRGQNAVLSLNRVFSPTFLSEFRLGFNRLRREVLQENVRTDIAGELGIPGLSSAPVDFGMPAIVVPGFDRLADNIALPIVRHDNTLHGTGILSWILGRHFLRAGVDARRFQVNGFNHVFARGQFIFQPTFTRNALADLLLGLPTVTIRGVNDNPQAMRAGSTSLFLQDDWKLRPDLILNLGLRYEYHAPPVDKHDRMAIYDTVRRTLVRVGTGGLSRSGLYADRNNFAPRFGLSWSPMGSSTLSVRSAYGIFYDANTLITNSGLYFNPPYFVLSLFVPGPTRILRLSDPFPAGSGFEPPPTVNTLAQGFRNAYSHHWHLTLDRQLGSDNLARVAYVGTKATKLVRRRNLNQPLPAAGDVDSRRPVPGAADITLIEPTSNSIYHALQVSFERRYAGAVQLLASYTFSRSIDDTSDFLSTNGDENYPQDSSRLYLERGLSNFDLRHRLTFTGMFRLPFGRGQKWGASRSGGSRLILSDWQLGILASLQSGFPFTPRLSRDNSNTGNVGGLFGSDRPDVVGMSRSGRRTADRFFDTQAFAVPPPYTFGNGGRNIVTGPQLINFDLSLLKRIPVGPERAVEFRAEIFNLFNTPPLGLPEREADQPATFGRILSAGPARQIQLAFKFLF